MKILQLTNVSDIGGAEKMVLNLVTHINRDKFDVSVASLDGRGNLAHKVRSQGLFHIDLQVRHPFRFLRKAPLFLRENRFDFIQTHGARAEFLGAWLGKLAGIRHVISTIHDVYGMEHRLKVVLTRVTTRRIDRWVAVTPMIKEMAIKKFHVPAKSIELIESGISFNDSELADVEDIRKKYQIPQDVTIILSVANLRPVKGHQHILRAITLFDVEIRRKVKFMFVGVDQSHGIYQKMARDLGVAEQVIFVGFVDDVKPYLAAANIFLLASESEGLPLSLLEAMAARLPVVASRVGGIPFAVRHNDSGVLIPPGSAESIHQTILQLIGNQQQCEAMALNAQQIVRSRFSTEKMVKYYEALYESIYNNLHHP